MTDAFGYDPALHDAMCWSICIPVGLPNLFAEGMRNSFATEDAAWRAIGDDKERCKAQGYSVVPIAWSYKPKFRKNSIHCLMPDRSQK